MAKKIKSTKDKIEALKIGLRALKNANNHFRETLDSSYMLTIQSQLRGLVGMGGSKMHPLLLNLSSELNIGLELYAFVGRNKKEKLTFSTVIGKTWSPVPVKNFKKMSLEEWLLVDDYFSDTTKQFKNRNQIIKDASNYEGGTHYLEETPHIVDSLQRIKVSNTDNLNNTLLDIAEAVFYLGHLLIFYWEYKNIESLIVIPDQEKQKRLQELQNIIDSHKKQFSSMGAFNFIIEGGNF